MAKGKAPRIIVEVLDRIHEEATNVGSDKIRRLAHWARLYSREGGTCDSCAKAPVPTVIGRCVDCYVERGAEGVRS